jgi:hypothetical protein
MTLEIKIEWKKSKYVSLAQQNGFCTLHNFAEAGKRQSQGYHFPEKTVMNMIWLLFPISELPIVMIGPGGFLLVVAHLFAVLYFYLYGWDWKKIVNN